jgi:hypothetical protein
MNIKRLPQALLLTATMALVACGGTAPADQSSESVGSRQDEIVYECDGTRQWSYSYYSDASKTTVVGDEWCDCFGTLRQWGRKTGYFTLTSSFCSRQ